MQSFSNCLEAALWFESQGCSVFPLEPRSKKPYASILPGHSWKEFQERRATPDEIRHWFSIAPDANLALVCGSISGIVVIDVDGEDGQKWFQENVPVKPNLFQYTSSKSKFHAFYKHPGAHVRIAPSVAVVNQIDVRGDASYVVIAPSVHPTGAQYSLKALKGFSGMNSLVPVPDVKLSKNEAGEYQATPSTFDAPVMEDVEKGARNSSLTSMCGSLYARGLSADEVVVLAHQWNNQHCKPPLPGHEVDVIARSMANTHGNNNPHMLNAGGVQHWVKTNNGEFTIADIYRDLNVKLSSDKERCRQELAELVRLGVIEPYGKKAGTYRKCVRQLDIIDLDEQQEEPLPFWLPFHLDRYCDIRPGNIIVVAGETNSGKTGFLFNIMAMNRGRYRFNYLSSEMTSGEIKARLAHYNWPISEWKEFVQFVQRSSDYHDAIDPDGINIIDFLEVYEDFSKIGADIKKIFDKLRKGIAIIAIQKKKGEDYGRGGEFTLEKARLGISLFTHGRLPNGIIGSAKITKCKNYKPGYNPEGKEAFYKFLNGYWYDTEPIKQACEFTGKLRFYDEKSRRKLIDSLEEYCKAVDEEQYQYGHESYYE